MFPILWKRAKRNGGFPDVSGGHQKTCQKFLDKLPLHEKRRLLYAIEQLPHTGDIKKMQGYSDYYRLRVGDYRIICTVDHEELIVCIVAAGNRGDIYK